MRNAMRVFRCLVVAVLVPLLQLGVGQAQAAYRCAFDGQTRSHCCCPTPAVPATPAQATLTGRCCDVERHASASPAARPQSERSDVSQLRAPCAGSLAQPPRPAGTAALATRHASQRRGPVPRPPLILLKQSFLI